MTALIKGNLMHVRSGLSLQCGLLLLCVCSALAQQNPTPAAIQANAIVTVTDHNHHPITGLKAEDFTLYLDGQKQPISSVASDVPACIGLIIDRSGSMRGRHAAIASAMADFVRAGNADDDFFVVIFNDEAFLDRDFTRDPGAIEQTIASADARGGTALYDTIIGSTDHLAKNKTCKKRALVIVGDGQDNSSRKGLEYTLASLRNGENPFVYIIWLPHPNGTPRRAESILAELAAPSGGAAYFVKSPEEVRKTALKIAEEIRGQYSISYEATANSGYSNVKVEAHAAGHKDLTVHANIAAPKVKAAPGSQSQ
jgi:VWFA-related protein